MKYLDVAKVNDIRDKLQQFLEKEVIEVDTENALGLKAAENIYSIDNVPSFNKSSLDGYAINYKESTNASETSPTMLTKIPSYKIGEANLGKLSNGKCQYVVTGAMIPDGCSGVVKIEDCEQFGNNILIKSSISKNSGIVLAGEEFKKETLAKTKNSYFTSRDISFLISLGIKKVKVYKPLNCIVISNGNELMHYSEDLTLGKIYDVNTHLITNELKRMGHNVIESIVLKDDYDLYLKTLKSYDVDLYVTSGGSSKGNEDFTADVFEAITNNVICHGISTKPGKPTIVAKKDGKLYLGLPGNPVSAFLVLHQLISKSKKITLPVSENINSDHGKSTSILVKIANGTAVPIYYKSGYLNSLAEADGYFVIDENLEGIEKGENVEVRIFE